MGISAARSKNLHLLQLMRLLTRASGETASVWPESTAVTPGLAGKPWAKRCCRRAVGYCSPHWGSCGLHLQRVNQLNWFIDGICFLETTPSVCLKPLRFRSSSQSLENNREYERLESAALNYSKLSRERGVPCRFVDWAGFAQRMEKPGRPYLKSWLQRRLLWELAKG